MKRIYIAGPMTGLPEYNYPAFHARAAALRAEGHHVENPAENPEPPCKSWQGYMRMALRQLATCDAVEMLPNWEHSKGACIEYGLAVDLGLEVLGAKQADLLGSFTVELPWPPAELSPNARVNWAQKSKAVKKYRAEAGWLALDNKLPRFGDQGIARVDVETTFYPPACRRYDRDNLLASIKAGLDGLAEHLRIDDHLFHPGAPVLEPFSKQGRARVVVVLKVIAGRAQA